MASSPSPSPLENSSFPGGRHVILKKLGSGSMGTVYLALDEQRQIEVALKIIRADRLTPDSVRVLQREFQTFASLRHPQIATAFDFGYAEENSVPYYTREYIRGTPLPPGPPLASKPQDFLRPILHLLDALHYLHTGGILHLDIHAGNVIVSEDAKRGSVLIDFGVLRSFEKAARSTSLPFGHALPPEIIQAKKAGPAADLYMAGRLLLYRLTGRSDCEARLLSEIPGWGPRLTLDLERIAAKALQPAPEQRFSSAREFRDALSRVLGEGSARPQDTAPLEITMGRDSELAALEESLRQLGAGRSSLLSFTGPSGSGKSRLLTEARLRAQLRGFEVLEVRFSAGPGSDPVLVNALQAYGAGFSRNLQWLQPLSREFGGTPAERSLRAAKAYFSEPGKAIVLILDDIDLADRESRFLVEALLREGLREPSTESPRALSLITASAKAPFGKTWKNCVHDLKPLDASDATDLLQSLLRPLAAPSTLLKKAVAQSGRLPLRLRQIAHALHAEWEGIVPPGARLPEFLPEGGPSGLPAWAAKDRVHWRVLFVLSVLRRAAFGDEIAAAAQLSKGETGLSLKKLSDGELITEGREGRTRSYQIKAASVAEPFLRGTSPRRVRAVHARLADHLKRARPRDPKRLAYLARHLLLSGRLEEGRALALQAAKALKKEGHLEHALDVLNEARNKERGLSRRLELAEASSEILEETGNHTEGIALLEPFHTALRQFPQRQRIRILRLLGIHCHRAGFPERALSVFEESRRMADPDRDREDLIFIDSELAELCTYQSRYDAAEDACIRGLERLRSFEGERGFKQRMEIILRASLGHLELRRMALGRARHELKAALKLAQSQGKPALEAVILNNLGIAERQLNCFRASRRSFQRAERLLRKAGEGRSLIKIACNLALLAAYEGNHDESMLQVERAVQLLRHYPGQRLEFFVSYTRGVVASLFGDAPSSADALEEALPLGRKLGDSHLVHFGEVLLAESHLACGRYLKALQALKKTLKRGRRAGPPLLQRMALARLLFVESTLGNERARRAAQRLLLQVPCTDAKLPEAWNDLFLGLAAVVSREPASEPLEKALKFFRHVKMPGGERLALAGLLTEALASQQSAKIEDLTRASKGLPGSLAHKLLSVLEPLLLAESRFFLGDAEGAEACLSRASGAIVGMPFLELDWRIELLRGRIALRGGDRSSARRHIQRSFHTRELLAELVPGAARSSFLAHPRFRGLTEAVSRIERFPKVVPSTDKLWSKPFEGMMGQSSGMVQVFQAIERLRDQEIPVLLRGETGTGKELAARALHGTSSRRNGPFLAVNCAALPEELLEAEFFGYDAGAFTGAEIGRAGILENLAGGTLLLDDVHQLPLKAQAKLLHALSSGRIRRLGGTTQHPIDVRVLSSTSIELSKEVERGTFRGDLFYRLRALEIVLPPLRERKPDIPLLARHFLDLHAKRLDRPVPVLESGAVELLESQDWPGNVRELESTCLRLLISLSDGERVRREDLYSLLPERKEEDLIPEELLKGRSFKELKLIFERAFVARLFREAKGSLRRVMSELGIRRTQLYALVRKLGLDMKKLREKRRP